MSDTPIDLDSHRGQEDQKAASQRREQLDLIQAAQAVREEDREQALLETPALCWSDVAPKVRFLLEIFATTEEANQTQRKKLIAQVLRELSRLESQTRKTDDPSDREA